MNDVGVVIGVAGVILSVIFYYKSLRIPEPWARLVEDTSILSRQLVLGQPIQVLYGQIPLASPRVLTAVFWNEGRGPLRGADVSSMTPLGLVFPPGARVISYGVDGTSRADVSAKLLLDSINGSDRLSVQFEFLDHRDWVRIKTLYEAATRRDVLFSGVVIGGHPLVTQNPLDPPKGLGVINFLMNLIETVLAVTIFLLTTRIVQPPLANLPLGEPWNFILGLVAAFSIAVALFIPVLLALRSFPPLKWRFPPALPAAAWHTTEEGGNKHG